MTKASPLKAYLKDLDDLPPDMLLGRIVLFTIAETPVKRPDLVKWFDELRLDATLLPSENKAVDSFKKATSDTKGSYPLSKDRIAHTICRDVTSNADYVRRQITREIQNAAKRQLSYDEAISITFYRATQPGDQTTSRLNISVNPSRLSSEELPHVRKIALEIKERYDHYFEHMDAPKIRAMVRAYLKKLNAIEIKGGVYFVHASRDEELTRLSELINRLGGDCAMTQIPMLDLERERKFIVRTFEREASQTLRDLTKEITSIAGERKEITGTTYSRLKARYDEVMANAEEHMLTLQISQDSTSASAEVAMEALAELQERMVAE